METIAKYTKEIAPEKQSYSIDAQREAVRKLIETEIKSAVDEELGKATQELLEEQTRAIRQMLEEQRRIIREAVEEEKKAIWARVEELRQSISKIGLK